MVITTIILINNYLLKIYFFKYLNIIINGDWGLGIGDWGLGIGDWAQSSIPNPQSPIPNPQSPLKIFKIYKIFLLNFYLNKLILFKII